MRHKAVKFLIFPTLVFALMLSSLLGFGCGNSDDSAETASVIDEYIIADPTGDWGYPSPYLRYSRGPGYTRMSYIFDTLIWKNEAGFIPALAEEWEYDESDNAYTFKLNKKVEWHDGEEFTAEDVAFTIDYVKSHPDPFVTLIGPSGITQTEIVDYYTIKLYLETTYAPFLNDIAGTMVILPEHIWKDVEDPMSFNSPEAVIGTGPYKLLDYDKAQGTYLFEAFEDYYQGEPLVKRLAFVKTSEETITAALRQGSVNAGEIRPEMANDMETDGFTIVRSPYGWNAKMTINHKKHPLDSKEFRQALGYAIDRQALVNITQRGHALPGSPGLLPPDNAWYNPAMDDLYQYDPAKARQLLEGLGYTLNVDGYFIKNGEYLKLDMITQTRHGFKDVGQFIKDALEDLGIKVSLSILESKTVDAKVEAWDFDLALYGHGGLYEPSILPKVISGPGFNSARYTANEILNKLLDDQLHEMNPDIRLEMVKQIQEIYAEDLPAITLYHPDWYWAHDSQVQLYYTNGGMASGIPIPLNKMAFVGR
ncbi:MAG: ABC transporter substrate-binding protein [Chloroflexota bacterium]|nr:ABC transporter substrate-binding protein [Chloroflexota bacterium]